MQLVFMINTFENDYECILNLLRLGAEHNRVKQYLCSLFQIDINNIESKNREEIDTYLCPIIYTEYTRAEDKINEKLTGLSDKWLSVGEDVGRILYEVFKCKCDTEEVIQVFLSINYVCPYDFDNKRIFINFRKTEEEIIESCIHELIHYYWFKKWNNLFENVSEFDEHLVWKFSEIAIDAFFKVSELNKYCVKEKPAYEYFYDIEIENENMIEHFRKLFSQNRIHEFMKKGIEYLVKYQKLIPD